MCESQLAPFGLWHNCKELILHKYLIVVHVRAVIEDLCVQLLCISLSF